MISTKSYPDTAKPVTASAAQPRQSYSTREPSAENLVVDTGWKSYIVEIWKCRFFWLSLVWMDLRTRYRRSILGIGWSLLHPVAFAIILCVVFRSLFGMDTRDYGPFLLSGLCFWNFLSLALLTGCESFYLAEAYIRQQAVPIAIYPLRTTLSAGVHFALGLAVTLIATWYFKGFGNVPVLWSLIPGLAIIFAFAWAGGLMLGVGNVFFPDTRHLSEVILQMLMYATPIIYPVSRLSDLKVAKIIEFNPLALLVTLVRQPITEGTVPSLSTFLACGLSTGVILLAALLILKRVERRIVFHL